MASGTRSQTKNLPDAMGNCGEDGIQLGNQEEVEGNDVQGEGEHSPCSPRSQLPAISPTGDRSPPARLQSQACSDTLLQAALARLQAGDQDTYTTLMAESQRQREREAAERQRELEAAERQRECEAAERQRERELEAAERQREREHQLRVLQLQGPQHSPASRESLEIQVPKLRAEDFPLLDKGGDLDTFLLAFEKTCRQYHLPEDQWVRFLTPRLRGKALEIFGYLPSETTLRYEDIKQALVRQYNLTPETYRKKLRSLQRGPNDSWADHMRALLRAVDQWTSGLELTTAQQLKELIATEQFLWNCPEDLQQYLRDRKPKGAPATATLADEYTNNRTSEAKKPAGWRGGKTNVMPAAPAPKPKGAPAHASLPMSVAGPQLCHLCRQPGHFKAMCPQRHKGPAPSQKPSTVLCAGGGGGRSPDNLQPVTVGQAVAIGLRDTGAEMTLVRPELVSPQDLVPGRTLTVSGIGGVEPALPIARVFLDWGAGQGVREVGVTANIPTSVLLGTDLGRLVSHYVAPEPPESASPMSTPITDIIDGGCISTDRDVGVDDVICPSLPQGEVTRACWHRLSSEVPPRETNRVQTASEEEQAPVVSAGPGVVGLPGKATLHVASTTGVSEILVSPSEMATWSEAEGKPAPLAVAVAVAAVTRSGSAGTPGSGSTPSSDQVAAGSDGGQETGPVELTEDVAVSSILATSSQGFQVALETDDSLNALKEQAAQPPLDSDLERVVWDQGRLYRVTVQQGSPEAWPRDRQLVVPYPFRAELLRVAHEIPMAGHLGVAKTKARLAQHFYWPKMGADVTAYCRSCDTCQRVGKAGPRPKAPLVTLPIIDEPFRRVAVDLIGPLSIPSSSGKRFVLTVVDYATRYPEAVALSSIRADKVATALLEIFSRVGFPEEMLTDRGTQFMSQLMESLCKQIQVQHLVSSPYHPQTNGLCERFNGTLKQMLKMLVDSHGRDWERYLPHLLFAYREVPQASTGFSPFELLYGRRVRGPLALVKEAWEGDLATPGVSVVEYVMRLRDKMQALTRLVHDNMTQAQANQKQWYDQNARERTYQVGQKVWVLVPVPQDKLQAAWEGPYVVHQQLNEVTYLVTLDHAQGRRKAFHVNMMKAHHEREACALPVCNLPEEGEAETLLDMLAQVRAGGSIEDVVVCTQLLEEQRSQLWATLHPFRELFSNQPGRTESAVHHVDTGNHPPIRRSAYRVSLEVQQHMRQEIDEMLKLGVIQASSSAWASPVVLVPKKDRTTRFCVDYRGLNAVTVTDAYPMPRIDDLLDQLAGAKYLTIMDLSRGYWQIPLTPEARERSAFITPFGLYESTVMPFGMKNAPATFQRMVNTLLSGLEGYAAAYLDDIAVFSPTWEDHLEHLSQVLGRIRQAGLTIKPEKCQMGMSEVHYLGHRVGGGALKPETGKVDAIASWPTPRTKKQVMSFLGTAGYYRKFVPHYSSLAKPLTDLTKKKLPSAVDWTNDCETAFRALKTALSSFPVLQAADFTRPFIVQTDASDFGLGAVLSQVDSTGQEHPVLYLSRKLLPREVAYSTMEKECLAIVWALQRLQPYLYGRHFTVETDHNPLSWLHTVSGTNGRLLRWSLALQQYHFTIRHKKGRDHGNADGLSRREEAADGRTGEHRNVLPPSAL